MPPQTQGILLMIGACSIWGLSPIYYKLLLHVPPLELLAHRTFWSLIVFAGLLAVQGRLRELRGAVGRPRAALITAIAALMITANWFLFILSVQIGQVRETSLGYYTFPLVAVLLGVVVLRERLSALQWVAVGLATLAVAQLTWGLGAAPWIALVLATTFGIYGIVKKRLSVGPVVSVTGEVLLLAPFALGWLAVLELQDKAIFGDDLYTSGLLVFSGLLTALPLVLFSAAAQRVNMTTLGVLQYLNPTLQFICAVVIFKEPLTPFHLIAFGLIWAALAIYSASGFAQDRARRKSAMTSSAEPPL
ncbi:chloramphenicol-sensitive protein RarD [Mameliella alba]|uniref:EamA family transporter RarD n=1 Tax=Mameliella alba TaxID=561184 RepID=UPI00088981D9|nr:EamA family transporter RarD [Mameliella alba]PTR36006.1 chloramphenicol-sensitive protein RarD [Mameliella alba]GGF81571.1 chloramphenicol resistance permease RarD [Mameliella alba]SDE04435.1 chloramphenicol-sensitive protein RarD [Mameliella alba]